VFSARAKPQGQKIASCRFALRFVPLILSFCLDLGQLHGSAPPRSGVGYFLVDSRVPRGRADGSLLVCHLLVIPNLRSLNKGLLCHERHGHNDGTATLACKHGGPDANNIKTENTDKEE
jgi:hypothetical protein